MSGSISEEKRIEICIWDEVMVQICSDSLVNIEAWEWLSGHITRYTNMRVIVHSEQDERC